MKVLKNKQKQARKLRKRGFTHREIAKKLHVAVGSAHLWTRDIELSEDQKEAIKLRQSQYYHKFTPEERRLGGRNTPAKFKPIYTQEILLKRITNFYAKHGRIPLKRELHGDRTYRTYFGTWNNAVRMAGFEPNPVLFARKFIAKDGHICDSLTERIIDDWLFKKNLKHKIHVPYPNSNMTADFVIGDIYIEFFGFIWSG